MKLRVTHRGKSRSSVPVASVTMRRCVVSCITANATRDRLHFITSVAVYHLQSKSVCSTRDLLPVGARVTVSLHGFPKRSLLPSVWLRRGMMVRTVRHSLLVRRPATSTQNDRDREPRARYAVHLRITAVSVCYTATVYMHASLTSSSTSRLNT